MNKYIYVVSIFSFLSVLFSGCEKDEIKFYDETHNAIRFPVYDLSSSEARGYDGLTQIFMSSWSFIEDPFVEETIYDLPVMLMGNTVDYDRKINFKIDVDKSTAPTDSYEILGAAIPAGEIKGYIRFKIYNVDELEDHTYSVSLTLQASDGLNTGPTRYLNSQMSWNNSIPAPSHTFFIRTYNMLIKSSLTFTSTSMANYSTRALKAITAAMNWYDWDDYSIHGSKYNSATYNSYKYLPRYNMIYSDNSYKAYALKLANYIEKYNEEHPDEPLVHDAGGLIGQRIEARTY